MEGHCHTQYCRLFKPPGRGDQGEKWKYQKTCILNLSPAEDQAKLIYYMKKYQRKIK